MNILPHMIKNEHLIEFDPVGIALLEDTDFEQQIIKDDDEMPWNPNDFESVFPDLNEFDSDILDDDICGDSIDMLDVEADEWIDSVNSIADEDEELIDMVLGLPAM
jgi:hypothetical protein